MHPSVTPLAAVLRLNTELLLNCLDGLNDEAASARPIAKTNSIAFLVAHLIDSRHFLAALLGSPLSNPVARLLDGARSIDDIASLPTVADLHAYWEAVSAHLAVLTERLDTPQLTAAAQRFPGSDGTLLGGLAFLVQHDTYHLGQIALLRRQGGFPAMIYTLHDREPGRRGA